MAAQVAPVRAVSRAPEEPPPLPSGDRPGRPRGGGRRRRGAPPGEAAGGKRARLSQPLLAGPGPAEPLPPAALPGLPAAAGLFTFSPLSLPPPEERRHHHHRHRPAAGPEPGRLAAGQPQKARRGSPADGAAGRPSKRGEDAGDSGAERSPPEHPGRRPPWAHGGRSAGADRPRRSPPATSLRGGLARRPPWPAGLGGGAARPGSASPARVKAGEEESARCPGCIGGAQGLCRLPAMRGTAVRPVGG